MTNITFDSLGLSPEVLHALTDLGFETPTPIQAESIPELLAGERDLLGFAQTGTGKTAAFSLPIVQQVDTGDRSVQALILCPTRELCMQITRDIESFTKYLPKTKTVAVYGGSSMYDQIRKIDGGAQIVVGTPGRVKDMIKRGKLKLQNVKWLVLDEADDMLDKGFKEDLDEILDGTPENKQTLLFSATMSSWIQKVAQKRMHNPKEIKVAAQNQGADTVEHQFVTVHARDRYAALRRLLDVNPDVYGIVFCRTRRDTKDVAAKLISHDYSAEAIHGDIAQNERSAAMDRFRKKHIQILVATDVAARGIDVNDLTHVINYELPDSAETYVHRSGRTGRAGKDGISITIINMRERGKLKRIENMMKKKFAEVDVPTGKAICEAQLMSLVHGVKTTEVDMEKLAPYLPAIYNELTGLTYEELIQHFVSVEFNRFLKHYSNIADISTQKGHYNDRGGRGDRGRGRGRDRDRGGRGRDRDRGGRGRDRDRGERGGRDRDRGGRGRDRGNVELTNYSINFGRNDGFNPKALFDMINKNQSLKGIEIGDINVQTGNTNFEADSRFHGKVLKFLGNEKFKGKPVRIDV
ncbi:DEAD/DEAH box helicase [Candidatus Peregrinibacteria bacterium]|jgi:ATP-dependent RNA helicase DeaD|nr:DEAD/DEAH box helicase [Candidatus Peregrinibacteria bacterium]MBT4631991.1 DEAD/DEAH box helicase [Candidatus Peregrinibacteria bacterium]MBT5516413.1 DEAD/DEAH box helicase [Candidatus Peregrinibacteria bacterium]MBT5823806.1 DEAD/DEAH box helicase [Candidatus Peregrinibacteria bacterium]